MKLRELISALEEAEKSVGPDALVFCGGVQSGDRELVSNVWEVTEEFKQHSSWRNLADQVGAPKNYEAVEIS